MIRSHCEAIIEQHYKVITPIFLSIATHDDYEWAPPYILKQIVKHWREESQYKRSRLEGHAPNDQMEVIQQADAG